MNSGMIQDGVQDISTFVPNQLKIFSNDWNLLKKSGLILECQKQHKNLAKIHKGKI
jgi:hypothetical protein